MSSPDHTVNIGISAETNRVLVVSDAHDVEVGRCVERLQQAEVDVELIVDVYTATAKLAKGVAVKTVLVDARTLDDKELAFLRMVPRFFPRCEVVVLELPGLQDRPVFHTPGVRMSPTEGLIETLIGDHVSDVASGLRVTEAVAAPTITEHEPVRPTETDAAAEAEQTWESAPTADESPEEEPQPIEGPPDSDREVATELGPQTPPEDTAREQWCPDDQPGAAAASGASPLSTDGGPEAAGTGPSMHEVVRRRMAADQEPTIRRMPPRSPPAEDQEHPPANSEPSEAEQSSPRSVEPMLSPEELDALLADREDEGRAGPPWTGREGRS